MIRAINKNGRETFFSERIWGMLPKDKNGWVEFNGEKELLIPDKIIEFQQKKKDVDAASIKNLEAVEELKVILASKPVKTKATVRRIPPKKVKR